MVDVDRIVLKMIGDVSEERLKFYDITGLLDKNGILQYVSNKHKIITGYAPSEVIGKRLIDRINPIDLPYVHEQHQKMVNTKQPIECKFEIKVKSGVYYVARSLMIPQFDVSGEFCGSVMLAKRRNVSIDFFRKTRLFTDLKYAI